MHPNSLRTKHLTPNMRHNNPTPTAVQNPDTHYHPPNHCQNAEDHLHLTTLTKDADTLLHQNAPTIKSSNKGQRFFHQTQANLPAPLVPYAWAEMNTKFTTTPKTLHGMDHLLLPNESTMAWSPTPNKPLYASTGNCPEAVPAPATMPNTPVQDVVRPLMKLRPVLKLRRHKALTPYHPNIWENFLHDTNILHKHTYTITGLCLGFHLDFPNIPPTQTPPNCDSVLQHATPLHKVVHNEIQTG